MPKFLKVVKKQDIIPKARDFYWSFIRILLHSIDVTGWRAQKKIQAGPFEEKGNHIKWSAFVNSELNVHNLTTTNPK